MNSIRHSSESPKWGTNPEMIAIAHAVLCTATRQRQIYVDPFSEDEFNAHVGAWRILTGEKGRDAFVDRWIDDGVSPRADHLLSGLWLPAAPAGYRVHVGDEEYMLPTAMVNPPGSEDGESVKKAWRILELMWRLGWLPGGAMWIGFTLNQMQTLQRVGGEDDGSFLSPLAQRFVRCIPARRMPYTAHSSRPATRTDKRGNVVENDDAPSHPSFLVLMPAYDDIIAAEQMRLFDSMGSQLGEVF